MAEAEGMIQGKQGGKGTEIMGFSRGISTIQNLQKPGSLHKRCSSQSFQKGKGLLRNQGRGVLKLASNDLVLNSGIPKTWLQL